MRKRNNSDDRLFWSTEDNTEQVFPGPLLTNFLIPLGSLLIAALALGANYEKLPQWVFLVIILYLAVVGLVSLAYPIKQVFAWLKGKYLRRQLAQRFYTSLEENVKALADLTADNRAHGFIYLVQQINNWDAFKEKRISLTGMAFMRHWLESIQRRMEGRSVGEFHSLAWDFSVLLMQYQMFCEDAYRNIESVVGSAAADPRVKDFKISWNVARENQMHLVKDWVQTAKKINEMAGDRVCLDYYEPLKML